MGNHDNWSTPKQIKIDRKGEPRPLRRGILKGERRKGKKARLDELLSSRKTLRQYADWILDERQRRIDHPQWFRRSPGTSYFEFNWERRFDESVVRHTKLLKAAMKDGIIEDAFDWLVFKP